MKLPILISVLILFFPVAGNAQDAGKQILAATKEVEEQLKTLQVSNELSQQCMNDVANSRSQVKQGNLFLALNTIRTCRLELASLSYAAAKSEVEKKGMDSFEQEWRQLGTTLSDKENRVVIQAAKRPAAIATALAQVSQIQARPYYQSGRLFALNSSLKEGLYYLGRAPANLDFAIFARGLSFPDEKTPLKLRSSAAELAKLETTVLRTYRSADVKSQQPQYNRLNSNLKVAAELDQAKMFEGALFKYLESKLFFGLIVTAAENEDVQHLRERSKEVGKQLKADKTDQSIAQLFWQMAETALNPLDETQPTQVQIKRASVILNNVLPSYFDYLKETPQ